jgi:hypothetical protein
MATKSGLAEGVDRALAISLEDEKMTPSSLRLRWLLNMEDQ